MLTVSSLLDSDCEGGLVCYYRANFDPVPGCVGQGEENYDYCVPSDTPDKALDFVGDEEWSYYELKECQGGMIPWSYVFSFATCMSSRWANLLLSYCRLRFR